ncbi:MAG: hypothetical protein ABI851_06285, partial [Saprospiraceae bacterium]
MNKLIVFLSCFINLVFIEAQVHLGPGQAYANIEAAFKINAIKPGDTVYLHKGSYSGYQYIANLHGTSNKWIIIKQFGSDQIDISGGWQFASCSYLRFENLNFKGNSKNTGRLFSVDNGGSCLTQSKHIVVHHCTFSNVTDPNAIAAFKFGGVDSFEVSNNIFKDFLVTSAMDYNVCHFGRIFENHLENCLTGGHIKGGASDITMERNLFINASQATWVAFELGGDTGAQFYCPNENYEVKNLNFYSNIVVGGYRGLALSSAVNCNVINNTFYNCGQATMRFLTTSVLYPTLSGNRVENNIFAFGNSAYINGGVQPDSAVSFSNNIYYSIVNANFNGPYWDTPDLDQIKDKNPLLFGNNTVLFQDAKNNNFNLNKGAPAIGKGKFEIEPVTDFYGNAYNLTSRSIGAIEVNSTLGIIDLQDSNESSCIKIFPNPAKEYIVIEARYPSNEVPMPSCYSNYEA